MKFRLFGKICVALSALLLWAAPPSLAQSQGSGLTGASDTAPPAVKVQAKSGSLSPAVQNNIQGTGRPTADQLAKAKQFTERPLLPAGPPLRKGGFAQPQSAPPPAGSQTQVIIPPGAQSDPPGPMVPSTFRLYNATSPHSVIPNGYKSNIQEPSSGMTGRVRFQTGNWYAAFSNNYGVTWTHLDPFTAFPSADGGFCCDQVVLYDPSRDMMIWYLQYIKSGSTASDSGRQRIAVFRNVSGALDTISSSGWITFDVVPSAIGGPGTGEWLDYPDLALSNDFLWVTTNVFSTTSNTFTRSVIYRVPLDGLRSGTGVTLDFLSQSTVGTLKMVQGAKDVMYFASHLSTGTTMRIFRWPENTTTIDTFDRTVSTWVPTGRGNHTCTTSDGVNWCGRSDERILAGALTWNQLTRQGELWWFWNVGENGSFTWPYIDAAKFRERDLTYLARPFIWNANFPYHYVAAAPNERGDLGLSIGHGNAATRRPNTLLCIDDDYNGDPPAWECLGAAFSTHSPAANVWGDYFSIRPAHPADFSWHATGMTLQGGSSGDNTVVRNYVFGRERDLGQYSRWFNR